MSAAHEDGHPQPKRHQLRFCCLPGPYCIVRLSAAAPVPGWATKGDFTSITRTADELSIVCAAANLPNDIDPGRPWRCFELEGPFPFSETGVLLAFIEPLSNGGIPIFAISTFDTDHVLIQEEHSERAVDLLRASGHVLIY